MMQIGGWKIGSAKKRQTILRNRTAKLEWMQFLSHQSRSMNPPITLW